MALWFLMPRQTYRRIDVIVRGYQSIMNGVPEALMAAVAEDESEAKAMAARQQRWQ